MYKTDVYFTDIDSIFHPRTELKNFLKNLHSEHKGVVKCKQLTRQSIWWPCLDKDIENYVSNCCLSDFYE